MSLKLDTTVPVSLILSSLAPQVLIAFVKRKNDSLLTICLRSSEATSFKSSTVRCLESSGALSFFGMADCKGLTIIVISFVAWCWVNGRKGIKVVVDIDD
jgi:hypothetical protein